MRFIASDTHTPFSTLLSMMQEKDNKFTIALPSDWLQGRTAYGGLSAAICLEAIYRKFPKLPPLRAVQFCFIGPATGQLQITINILRQGKSMIHISADLEGDNGLAVRGSFCFGIDRESAHHYSSLTMPQVPNPDACPSYYTWDNRPNFMNHFEGRLAKGARPSTLGKYPEMCVWLRHQDQNADVGIVQLLALADALPPAAMILFNEVIPISTMTWSIEMLNIKPVTESGWWLTKCSAETIEQGYSVQNTTIWNSSGSPILIARQSVAVFG